MEKTFEASLTELESIVRQLEQGDLPLEESLKLFEAGVKLARVCRERLTQAEKRIEIIVRDSDGNLRTEEFDKKSESAVGKRIAFDGE